MYYRGFFIDISSDCTECIRFGDCSKRTKKASCSFYSVRIFESELKAYEFHSFECSSIDGGENMAMQLIDNFFYEYIDDYLEWVEENDISPSYDFLHAAYVHDFMYE